MAKPKISTQVKEIESIEDSHPKEKENLRLYKGILEILEPIEKMSNLGLKTTIDWGVTPETAKVSLKERRHLSTYLDPSIFDAELVGETILRLVDYFIAKNPSTKQLFNVSEAIMKGSLLVENGIVALLAENASWFHENAQKYGVEPSLLFSMFELPLRPFFEEMARKYEKFYVEDWWEQTCPICGRGSPIGRMRSKKLYLVCQYCGSEYLVDLFQCFNCGSKDPTKLEFASPEGRPYLELHYCVLCKNYIKIINENRLHEKVPSGLEDLLTSELDELAKILDLISSKG